MQKTAALTLALALLFSVVTVAIFANLAKANPAPLFSFPTAPVTTSPTITITSPLQDQTYNSNNAWLNISIVKPETWFGIEVLHHTDQTFVNITSVYYVVDTGERQNVTVHDVDDLFDAARCVKSSPDEKASSETGLIILRSDIKEIRKIE